MSSPSSPDQIKILVRHYIETTWNSQDLDDMAAVPEHADSREETHSCDSLCPLKDPLRVELGAERLSISLAQVRKIVRKTFPDIRITIMDLLVEGEKVAVRWTLHGTDLGGYDNHLPTGKPIRMTGISMLRLENESIVEEWIEVDIAGMLHQLGYVYMPQPPRITMRRSGPALQARKGEK